MKKFLFPVRIQCGLTKKPNKLIKCNTIDKTIVCVYSCKSETEREEKTNLVKKHGNFVNIIDVKNVEVFFSFLERYDCGTDM